MATPPDTGEKMGVSISSKLSWQDIFDAVTLNPSIREMTVGDELAEPRYRPRVHLVVEVAFGKQSCHSGRCRRRSIIAPFCVWLVSERNVFALFRHSP